MTLPSRATTTLLGQAEAMLDGTTQHRARYACWVARAALELIVETLLVDRGLDPGGSSMRSRLTCLQVAYQDRPSTVSSAQFTWTQLSQACHQHAYDLGPTIGEVRALVASVARLNT